MKRLHLLFISFLLGASGLFAQGGDGMFIYEKGGQKGAFGVPQAINFQAIARDAGGNVMSNTTVMIQLSILEGSATGKQVYREIRSLATNSFGSFSFQIGIDPFMKEGEFTSIDWASGQKYMKVDFDPTASLSFDLTLGTIAFASVPYSLATSSVSYIDMSNVKDGDILVYNSATSKFEAKTPGNSQADWNTILNKPTLFSGSYTDLTGKPDMSTYLTSFTEVDGSVTNEIQTLSLSGNSLSLSNGGGSVTLASGTAYTAGTGININSGVISSTVVDTDDQTLTEILSNSTSAGNKNITDLKDPVNAQDAATKAYVDMLKTQIENQLLETGLYRLKDIDGNMYTAVKIGNQIWMGENLRATRYSDGTVIPQVTDNTAWANLGDNDSDKAYCFYDNAAINSSTYYAYGALYTYAAATNGDSDGTTQGVCPTGWHLPCDAEWITLGTYLGGTPVAGGKLKETGTTHWISPNTGADNTSGFSARPGGSRFNYDGAFSNAGNTGYWWSATLFNASNAWLRLLNYDDTVAIPSGGAKSHGFSVRCLRD